MIGWHTRKRPGHQQHECPITKADIAFAMELRTEGISWANIGWVFGVSVGVIKSAVNRATATELEPSQ